MTKPDFSDLDLNVARARIALSVIALISVYVDPTVGGGYFKIDRYMLAALTLHLGYGCVTYFALRRRMATETTFALTTTLDIFFATAIAYFTEGLNSPGYVFFAFAIIAVGCRAGLRATVITTFASVILYLMTIGLSWQTAISVYIMRPTYLAITGCLIGFLGQQRANFEVRVRQLETITDRQMIARSLHDGYVQALAGVNLRLEGIRELLQRSLSGEALEEVTELQIGVTREFDEVRTYIRSLATLDREIEETQLSRIHTRFHVATEFSADGLMMEHVFQIMLEGMRNARRHANASVVTVNVHEEGGVVRIAIDDDGVGFQEPQPPWAIASRVAEFGGHLRMVADGRPGAHLEIEMPTA